MIAVLDTITEVLPLCLAVVFLAVLVAGVPKAVGVERTMACLGRIGVNRSLAGTAGTLEVLGALGLVTGVWYPGVGLAAAAALVAWMIGAVAWHARVRDSLANTAPALLVLCFTITTLTVLAAGL